MCRLFRKKNPVHEPIERQIEDVKKFYPMLADQILNGLNCDSIPGAKGAFGSINNPIPVNSAIGQIKYLGKLRGKTGRCIFHRFIVANQMSQKILLICMNLYALTGLNGLYCTSICITQDVQI